MPKYWFNSREVQTLLNGFICLFKPRDVSISALEKLLLKNICNQSNQLNNDRPLPVIDLPIIECHSPSGALMVVGKKHQIDYSMHPLMVGQMFRPEDFYIESLNFLEPSSSGICLFGLNNGCDQLERIREHGWLNEYILEGELGKETYQHKIRGKVNFCAEYDHVSMHRMNKLLSKIQMHFKKAAFEMANLDLQSEEAFELARKGAPRPRVMGMGGGNPLIYGIKMIHFKAPLFKLRLQIMGESDIFLRELVHEIGCSLDTTARPRRLQRVRQGCFGLEHALLDKHFHLESVVKNMLMSGKMVEREMAKGHREVVGAEMKGGGEGEDLMAPKYGMTNGQLEMEEIEDCLRLPFGRDYTIC